MAKAIQPSAPAEAEPGSSRRKAPVDANRIPGSAASMHVQERTQRASASTPASSVASTSKAAASALQSKGAIAAMQPFLDSSTTAASPIEPTDIQLLTTSILSNQERQRVILFYQEKLIHSEPTLSELKQSLLFLSSASWGQILEERNLAHKCSYPPCPNSAPAAAGPGGRGKFRIDLRSKSVKALEDRDLGEPGHTFDELRDLFCSRTCYARSEWILRWVLSDKEIGLRDEPAKGDSRGTAVLGGKWQKLTAHPGGYEDLELLEDLEAQHGLDLDAPDEAAEALDHSGPDAEPSTPTAPTRSTGHTMEEVDKALGGLNIIERGKSDGAALHTPSKPATPAPAASTATVKTVPSRTAYTVDVPNTVGTRFTPTSAAPPAQDEEDEMDAREREMGRILRFASLATGSRPRPRNTTLRIDFSSSATSAPPSTADDEPIDPPDDPSKAAERAEIARIMDQALAVRHDQRQQGLLD
ncbi:hypothetical protein PaG_03680 [Moesziomyces aphidis]|uniref:RNA polymerase II subunit B1 CTD phosphatase RPAP2 homolog n=1 Tax=Moesziomyces aphidis TaxID=84754 RepID=W3VKT0_MOEAP|nr:hypothetical protein PaG_03680 [Moesziomyces aphidis]